MSRSLPTLPLAALLCACGGPAARPIPFAPAPDPAAVATPAPASVGPPNFVIILADDLGYGDLSSFGAASIKTPNLDRLAAEGARLTHFVVPAPICAAARAALLTGRYPPRNGITWNPPRHLREGELTLAEVLRPMGYATYAVGKWHLGYDFEDMPLQRGFDHYYGLLDDNSGVFLRDNGAIQESWGDDLYTRRYTEEAVGFLREVGEQPFLLYLAHRAPHAPLYASASFEGRSTGGLYGDVVEELDGGVGEVMKTLAELGLDRRTVVFFASDNGPWLAGGPNGGSAGPLYGGKGTPWEGGLRQPAIAWGPGRISGGVTIAEATSMLDLFPTVIGMAGGQLPADRTYDGQDISPLLTGRATRLAGPGIDGGRELLAYVFGEPVTLRSGRWKYIRRGFWSSTDGLYDLETDPGETTDVARDHPELVQSLSDRLDEIAVVVATTK